MKTYTIEIDKLFNSIGFFPKEYKEILYNLDMKEQNDFISELYKRITSEQYKYQQGKDAFGTKIFERNIEYRYSSDDLEEAKKMNETLSGETFLKSIGKENECLLYKATYVFHQRKIAEIEFETPEIERLYKSIVSRVEIKNTIESLIDKTSIFKDIRFEFIEYPRDVTANKLNTLLKENNFESCFSSADHYQYFKQNTFKLFTEAKTPLVLSIPLTKNAKKQIPKKLYKLYNLYKKLKTTYPEIDLSRSAYGKALMFNFSEFRTNSGYSQTFEAILENATKEVRK